ncbi:MAG: NAD(+)/NADH kinase [Myxococcales bacterium]|nr:NAD(+)/NADH kinase [Myxococcales bacterium]
MSGAPRAVVVTRPTELEHVVARHGTRAQARFALAARGQSIDDIEGRHAAFEGVLTRVSQAIPSRWRSARVGRADLPRFVWEPGDIVLAVGQDGLVANVAKYLTGQLVVGVNPDPSRIDGVLVRHGAERLAEVLARTMERRATVEERTLVEAELDDGQRLRALNEIYLGHRTHQSSRYSIGFHDHKERQSSSGIIVATGTGSTGWARSIAQSRRESVALPAPAEPVLAFFVREAFPSVSTGCSITQGRIGADEALEVRSEIEDGGVIFGDGLEDDRLRVGWGMRVQVKVAPERLHLVV